MAYCGCRTCCAKTTWTLTILLLIAAAAGLAAGLYRTVPCTKTLVACNPANTPGNKCWNDYWTCTASGNARGLFFYLSIAGAGCFFLSLLTCCCFCCQRSPRARAAKQDQFIAGSGGGAHTTAPGQHASPSDTAVYSDQYAAYAGYGDQVNQVKPTVAHV